MYMAVTKPSFHPKPLFPLNEEAIAMDDEPITIESHQDPDPRIKKTFTLYFYSSLVHTTVTSSPSVISNWIYGAFRSPYYHRNKLVVGLGVQWRPWSSNDLPSPAATLQLCIGSRCLIIQLCHAEYVPHVLRRFLNDTDVTFVGVWNGNDRAMLSRSHLGLNVERLIDLRLVAAESRGLSNRLSMESLASILLGADDVEKDEWIGRSDWDDYSLSDEQVQYACVDAYVSFLLGKELEAWNWY